MADEQAVATETAVVEAVPETAVVETVTQAAPPKGKNKTGNLILDVAHEVSNLTKTKALHMADQLNNSSEENNFKLGGILQLISDQSWFEGYPTFGDFVFNRFGFQERKAKYLMSIYKNLVEKQIPWEKVSHLGWTKLKDLAPVLTVENLDEWIAKATPITVAELQAILAGATTKTEEAKTKADVTVMKFPLKQDQVDIVNKALAKAKGVLNTEFDTVALENIMSGYLGGTTSVSQSYDLDTIIQNTGFEALLQRVSDLYPMYYIKVSENEPAEATEAAEEVVVDATV